MLDIAARTWETSREIEPLEAPAMVRRLIAATCVTAALGVAGASSSAAQVSPPTSVNLRPVVVQAERTVTHSGGLARTGSDVAASTVAGAGLAGAGVALVLIARRRRSAAEA